MQDTQKPRKLPKQLPTPSDAGKRKRFYKRRTCATSSVRSDGKPTVSRSESGRVPIDPAFVSVEDTVFVLFSPTKETAYIIYKCVFICREWVRCEIVLRTPHNTIIGIRLNNGCNEKQEWQSDHWSGIRKWRLDVCFVQSYKETVQRVAWVVSQWRVNETQFTLQAYGSMIVGLWLCIRERSLIQHSQWGHGICFV